MQFYNPDTDLYVPDGTEPQAALARTTHLCIAAHQDDIEIMAYHGIVECFGLEDRWFTGVVVTNGAGSPRAGIYSNYTDQEMQVIRKVEQRKAAFVGGYSAMAQLGFTSGQVKDAKFEGVCKDLESILSIAKPRIVYLHNLADKHDTHVSVALRAIGALRRLKPEDRPEKVYGCEVWRDLDWLVDDQKVALDVSGHESLQAALLGVFDSQICGGKRYDLAAIGRRRAHATYHASHGVDASSLLTFAMDLSPLMADDTLSPLALVEKYMTAFSADVRDRLRAMG